LLSAGADYSVDDGPPYKRPSQSMEGLHMCQTVRTGG
jgi:hypothetical protein